MATEEQIVNQLKSLKIEKENLETEIAETEAQITALEAGIILELGDRVDDYRRREILIAEITDVLNYGGIAQIATQEVLLVQADLARAENELARLISEFAYNETLEAQRAIIYNLKILLIRANNGVQIPNYWDTAKDKYAVIYSNMESELESLNDLFSSMLLSDINDAQIEINNLKVLL